MVVLLFGSVKRHSNGRSASDRAGFPCLKATSEGEAPASHPTSSTDIDGYRKGSGLDAEEPVKPR